MYIIKGDLIDLAKKGYFDVIIHGCNCYNTMGAGIARSIKQEFPEAYKADQATERGSKKKLGTFSYAKHGNLTIINAYTQFDYSSSKINVDYRAIKESFEAIRTFFHGKRFGIPKIGAGLAGGDWEKISKIIDEAFKGENLTLVEYIK